MIRRISTVIFFIVLSAQAHAQFSSDGIPVVDTPKPAVKPIDVKTSVNKDVVVSSTDSTKGFVKPVVAFTPIKPKPPKPISKEIEFGLRLNTDGWSIYMDRGKVKTNDWKHSDLFHNLLYWEAEFTEKTNPKEVKVTSTIANQYGGSSSYKYGKINNLYALKMGIGFQKLLVGKPDPGCVSIHWANTFGFSLGMLKPYYIYVEGYGAIKYSDQTQNDFLSQTNNIEGSAGFSKGLSEVVFIPGGYFRSALHFDYSTNKKTIMSVETGVNIEYYSQQIQLMANQSATSSFIDMFIAISFGKRW